MSNNKFEDYPVIGNNVTIYAGAIIIGKVIIGDNAIIGAGCIVTKDVPEGKIAIGSPMKIMDKNIITTNYLSEFLIILKCVDCNVRFCY